MNLQRRPPQAGLEVADVVYEEPVEGATRFLAVFHSTLPPAHRPPSARRASSTPGIVWPLGGLYVYSGGYGRQGGRDRGVAGAGRRTRTGWSPPTRASATPDLRAPHNLFVVPESLLAWEPGRGPHAPRSRSSGTSTTALRFAGDPASVVAVPTLSDARYRWDPASGSWKREALNGGSDAPVPHLTESGEQVAPQNVIVQRIPGLDDKSVLLGEGPAWVCSQGRCVAGRWRRASLDDRTEFVAPNGTEIRLTPGRTWVHLITSGDPTITP
ncbi:MAG: hypothetical protein KatS3mg010_0652 [Acidimicrobiia bacterium]|nr:MAG: hypothetical protein KatS3mg010_0652 [Acidimicrobiia bacterium]